jgi:hypothetical protein
MRKPSLIALASCFCASCAVNQSAENPTRWQPWLNTTRIDHATCEALFVETEGLIRKTHTADHQNARIEGFRYLRNNRFLASYRHQVFGPAFKAWLEQLQKLGVEDFRLEINNLPTDQSIANAAKLLHVWQTCSQLKVNEILATPAEQNRLRERAAVASEYRFSQQLLGLYPLTATAFRLGIWRWHRQTLESYSQPLAKLKRSGQLVRYTPEPKTKSKALSSSEVAEIIQTGSQNPLKIPLPTAEQQQQLFDHFSPVLEIDQATEADLIGAPTWQADGKPIVDTAKPTIYRHLSHTRLGTQALLQLNYLFWFPSRPQNSKFDLLAGAFDGLIWRITLLPNGQPWLFDSIHSCGCYHLFFPSPYAQKIASPWQFFTEPAFTPQASIRLEEHHPAILRIAARTHYLERVYTKPNDVSAERRYRLDNADRLRALPLPNNRYRSLFNEEGFIEGSERAERFLFWPMGIPNPGAMRQWGHHATAFVGRRHFDDPKLLESNFKVIERVRR